MNGAASFLFPSIHTTDQNRLMHRIASCIICAVGLVSIPSAVLPQRQSADLLYVSQTIHPQIGRSSRFRHQEQSSIRQADRYVEIRPGSATRSPSGNCRQCCHWIALLTTPTRLAAIDVKSEKIVWEQTYDGECCDRMTVSPNGKLLYVPPNGSKHWYVADAMTGNRYAI